MKVLVIGGGFCGMKAARVLDKKGFEVTLVDDKDHFEFTPSIYKTFFDPTHGSKLMIPFSKIFKKARLIKGRVDMLEESAAIVGKERIEFDYLVVSSGAEPMLPKGFSGAFVVKRLSDIEMIANAASKTKTALICGGGHVGVEVAAELAKGGIKVTILHGADRLIERTPPMASMLVQKKLEKMGVQFVFSEKVLSVKESVVTTEKRIIQAGCIIWSIGVRPSVPSFWSEELISDRGVVVNEFLQTKDPRIFSGGDCNNFSVEKTAQNAMIQGEVIAKNIELHSKGKPLIPYHGKTTPILVDLGGNYGVFISGNLVLSGFVFGLMKKMVEVLEIFSLKL